MAGDWIKMRTTLDSDPRVIEMATMLDTSELHVVGMLWKVWSWADTHSIDGNAIRVTHVTLDRFTGVTGFADALRKVGWLDGRDNAITFPRFAEHNGQTAKKRAETKERVAKHRNSKCVTDVTQNALPEKRREEKSYLHTHSPKKQDVFIPEELADCWERWCQYREAIDGRRPDPVSAQANLMELSRRGPDKAERDVDFSIRKNAKSILDSSNNFESQSNRARSSGKNQRGGQMKSVAELLGKEKAQ